MRHGVRDDKIDRAVPDPRVGVKRPPEDDSAGADRALPGAHVPRAGKFATVFFKRDGSKLRREYLALAQI